MSSSFSSAEARMIIASAQAALKTIDEIICEQEGYAKEIAEYYEQLLDQGGNKLARSISLIRMGPGKYRTLAGGKKSGTKSNLYLAATSGKDATIQTRSGTYRAQECYERVLDIAGVDKHASAFEDLVFSGYKKWLHEEIIERSLAEWKAMRSAIAEAVKAAEPALQGGLARLFMDGKTKQAAFDALDKLQEMGLAQIASSMDYWPEFRAKNCSSKRSIFESFQNDKEDRNNILSCLHKELGRFKINGSDRRKFSSEDAQRVLAQLEGISGVPSEISSAQKMARESVAAAIDELREGDVRAQLAQAPIDELGKQKTGARIRELQDTGVHTLADLHERIASLDKGALPGVGPKVREAIEAYLGQIVAGLRRNWRLGLSADERTDAATQLVRTVQTYIELGNLRERALEALAAQSPLSDAQNDALLYATDQLDWLLADNDHVHAASDAMDTARKCLGTKDGKWLLMLLRGSKIKRLVVDLVSADRAWKGFVSHPDLFMKAIEEIAPEVLAPAEPDAPTPEEKQPEQKLKKGRASREGKRPKAKDHTKAKDRLLEQTKAYYTQFEGTTMLFPPAGDAPVFDVESKYSVGEGVVRIQGDTFSLAIPNGWVSLEDAGDRAFVLVPGELAREGLGSDIAILYGRAPVPDDFSSGMREHGMLPIQWAVYYSLRSRVGLTVEMHEVEACNCRCAVVQVTTALAGCYEFYVYPYSLIGADYVRVTFYDPDDITYEQARTFADNLARTVEADGPMTPECLERIDERFMGASSVSDAWNLAAAPLVSALEAPRQDVFDAGLSFFNMMNSGVGGEKRFSAGLCAVNQYLDLCVPYVARLVELLSDWANLHSLAGEDEKNAEDALSILEHSFTLSPSAVSEALLSAEARARLCKPSPRQEALLSQINEVRAMLNLPASAREDAGQEGAMGDSEPEPAPTQDNDTDLVVFFLTFLSSGWFFFSGDIFSDASGITWDGSKHSITNLKIDSPSLEKMRRYIQEFDAGFENESEVADYVIAVLSELEKDKALRVPRKRIARGVQKALPKGPLTGLTLASLCESSGGLIIKGGFDKYQVLFDARLSRGIPQFFSLVARMLWDLRSCVKTLSGMAFDVLFASMRNLDADSSLGAVDEPVEGAQDCPVLLHVTELPEVAASSSPAAKPSASDLKELIEGLGGSEDDIFALSADGQHTLLLNDAACTARLDGSRLDLETVEYSLLRFLICQKEVSFPFSLGRSFFGEDERYASEKLLLLAERLQKKLGDSDRAQPVLLDCATSAVRFLGSEPRYGDPRKGAVRPPELPDRIVWEPEGTLQPIDTKALGLPYELDVENWQIVVRGEPVWTHPNWFRILYKLTSAPGRVFSSEELKEGLFNKSAKAAAGPIVSHYIGDIRALLGESGKNPHYIRNKPRVGYWLELD